LWASAVGVEASTITWRVPPRCRQRPKVPSLRSGAAMMLTRRACSQQQTHVACPVASTLVPHNIIGWWSPHDALIQGNHDQVLPLGAQ